MSKHSGPRVARPRPRVPRRRLLVLASGVTVTLVAWGFLVFAAIQFGQDARGGQPVAWVFLALATIGAAACLFLTLILGTKVLDALTGRGVEDAPAPSGSPSSPAPSTSTSSSASRPATPGGRRAAR